jgi:hypothetical protein
VILQMAFIPSSPTLDQAARCSRSRVPVLIPDTDQLFQFLLDFAAMDYDAYDALLHHIFKQVCPSLSLTPSQF